MRNVQWALRATVTTLNAGPPCGPRTWKESPMISAPSRLAASVATLALGGALLAGCSSAPATSTSAAAAKSTSASTSTATSTTTKPATSTTSTSAATSSAPAATAYTMDAVKTHNSASSCWSVINGTVYDLTAWINAHPGGAQRIKSICGIDGTSEFKGAHSGENGPNARLATFKLGPLS